VNCSKAIKWFRHKDIIRNALVLKLQGRRPFDGVKLNGSAKIWKHQEEGEKTAKLQNLHSSVAACRD
jgi:hypothetical protein